MSATERNEGTGRTRSHSWVVIFAFGVKECGLHKDQVGVSGGLVGNDGDGKMPIQKRPSGLKPSSAVVVGVTVFTVSTMDGGSIAVAVAVAPIGGAGMTIAVAITSRARIAVDIAVQADDHRVIAGASAFRLPAYVHVNVVRLILRFTRAISDRTILGQVARLVVEFNSGIEQ